MPVTVSAYTDALVEAWLESFIEEHVLTRGALKMKVKNLDNRINT